MDLQIQSNSLDLIISEDVFEHIPTSTLNQIIPRLRKWLKPDGLALIRPNIFTGITGGHLGEWSVHNVMNNPNINRKSEPWEHLRKNRFKSLSYLNELKRSDYRRIFNTNFKILEEIVSNPFLGKKFYSPDVEREIKLIGEDEIFSNQVLFILKPK